MPDALSRYPKGDACRLCLVSREGMEPIFDDPRLALAITETVRLKICKGDGLPTKICQPCIDQLDTASRFIQRCHLSDAQLRHPLYKVCERTGELEVIASASVETSTAEPSHQGNWACSLTPIKTELQEEPDTQSLNMSDDFSEIHLKTEVIEGTDPLEESEITEPTQENIWDNDSAGASNYPLPNNSSWQDHSLQAQDSSWQELNQDAWQQESMAPSGGIGWQSNYTSSLTWQQEPNTGERKTEVTTSPGEATTSFNISGDGVLIEPSVDTDSATHANIPFNIDMYSSGYLSGLPTENQPLFTCYLCPKSFTTNRALSCHVNMGHKQKNQHKSNEFTAGVAEGNRLWCSLCNTSFAKREELVKHMQAHRGQSSYCCSRCGKGFHSQQALKVHTKTHAKEKRYKCTKCEKSFSLRSYFRVHQLTHSTK